MFNNHYRDYNNYDPCKCYDPCNTYHEPYVKIYDPCNTYHDPCVKIYDPCKCYNPCEKYHDPCKKYYDPCCPKRQETIFRANLSGRNEVPPNNSIASGSVVAKLSDNEKRLNFVVRSSGYNTPIISAHFHLGGPGVNGPVVKTININPLTGDASGSWTLGDNEPLTSALVNSLKRGDIYVNIHTSQYPNGEIRGQLYNVKC